MNKAKWQRLVAAPLVALMLAASFAPAAMAVGQAAMVAQTQGAELGGTIPGGQFAKFWLGLKPIDPGTVTVRAEWDRESPVGKGLGFYILDEGNLSAVVNGEPLQDNNIAAGDTTFFLNGANNVQGAAFRATGPDYTVVVYNDSAADANFKLIVENGILKDDSGQIQAPAGAATPAATDAAAPAVAATDVTTTTTAVATATATAAAAAVTTTVAAATPAAVVATTGGAVSAQELKGELLNQFDQHFLALKPTVRDGDISVVMTYDPQDSTELARRINFWVLDQNGFVRYQEGESAADVAIAAGSKFFLDPDTSNKREASFNAAGFGPYTVIVQNNSRVPATYDLSVTGGILTDDSNQTLTAQQSSGVTTTTTVDTTTAPAATTTTTTTTTTTAPVVSTTGVVGQPGGTYTVAAGDTLAIIARDIYGDYRLYEQLCAFNSIADCNTIEVGQVVKLPTREQIGATATVAPAATTAAAAATPAATTAATPAATTAAVATPAATAATTTTATSGVTTTAPVTNTGTTTTTSSVSSTTTTTKTTTTAPATTKSLIEVATGAGDFTILLDALKQTGIDADLAGAGPYTVFAPTDAAFNALLSGNGLTEAQLLQAKELADILRYHVLSGKVLAADVTNGLKATTLQGKPVTFEVKDGKVYINGAQIVTTDIPAANGVIHAIDAVILPPN